MQGEYRDNKASVTWTDSSNTIYWTTPQKDCHSWMDRCSAIVTSGIMGRTVMFQCNAEMKL